MELEILEKLSKIQNAHNELGNYYEKIAKSKMQNRFKSIK